ncbi:hypothetical protein CLU79DRAFT_835727 [Phycomyces nitens]|nr:hypothetical protein CLU79DRAFT_835727 [Phycomyces nitens]
MGDLDDQLQANTYIWTQSDDQVTLSFLVPETCSSKDFDIVIKPQYVKAGLKGQPPVIQGKLFAPVNHFASLWQIEKNSMSPVSSITASPSLSIASSYAFMSSPNHSPNSSMILPAPALAESSILDQSAANLAELLQQTAALGSSSPSPDVSQPSSPIMATPPHIETPPLQGQSHLQPTTKYRILTLHLEKEEEGLTWAVPISGSMDPDTMELDPTSAFHLGVWLEARMGHMEKALVFYLSAAQRNYTRAMIKVAALYEFSFINSNLQADDSEVGKTSHSVPRDPVKAFEWYKRAADMPEQTVGANSSSGPDPLACYIVGSTYGSGSTEAGVEKSYVDALAYFNRCMAITSPNIDIDFGVLHGKIPKSALRNHAPHTRDERYFCSAAFQTGLMYLYGSSPAGEQVHSVTTVEADPQLAIRYWQEAGILGHAQACYNLGILYANSMGVEQDLFEAGRWFGRAGKLDPTGKLVVPEGVSPVTDWDAIPETTKPVELKSKPRRKKRRAVRKQNDTNGLSFVLLASSVVAIAGVAWWYYRRNK